jgi:transposase
MIALPTNNEIFLYSQPTDMRKGFSGLAGIIRSELQRKPNDGSLFLFINRRKDKIKALYWDTDGMAIWYKSLEQGTFEMIKQDGQVSVKIDAAELAMLLGGVSIENAKRRKRLKVA